MLCSTKRQRRPVPLRYASVIYSLPPVLFFLNDLGMPCNLDSPSLTSLSPRTFSSVFILFFCLSFTRSPPPTVPSVYLGVLSLIRASGPSWQHTPLNSSMSALHLHCLLTALLLTPKRHTALIPLIFCCLPLSLLNLVLGYSCLDFNECRCKCAIASPEKRAVKRCLRTK